MELIHTFVTGYVYCNSEVHVSRGSVYLICDARVNGRLSITIQKNRVLTKVGIRAILTVVTQAWSSLGYFENLNFKVSNEF